MSGQASEPRTYGNWRQPQRAGIGKFSFGATIGGLGGIVVIFLSYMLVGWKLAAGEAVVIGLALFAVTSKNRYGLSISERIQMRMAWNRANKRRTNRKAPALFTGSARLPGLLGKVTVEEHQSALGMKVAFVRPMPGRLVVPFQISPSGVDLLDQEVIDQNVARWGLFLSNLGNELGVVQAAITVETAPDTGARLQREVLTRIDDGAPEAARVITQRIVESYGQGAVLPRCWVTLTFNTHMLGAKKSDGAPELLTRLPGLLGMLRDLGVGGVHPLTAAEVVKICRCAFDPASEEVFETALLNGEQLDLDITDAVPNSALDGWDYYRHDAHVSVNYMMAKPPRGVVQSGVLGPLLRPTGLVDRKRVSILYKPLPAEKAPDAAEKDIIRAEAKINQSRRVTARDRKDYASAVQVANEEASGAGLVDFQILVTATAKMNDLADLRSQVESLGAQSRLLLRPAWGVQGAVFALGLPFGLEPQAGAFGEGWK